MRQTTATAAAGLVLAALTTTAGAAVLERTFDDPTVTGFDFFGTSVALSGDRVLIGAPFDDTQGDAVGQAHLFDLSDGPAEVPLPGGLALYLGGLALAGLVLRRRAGA